MRRLILPLTVLALAFAPGVASAQQTLSRVTFDGEATTLSDVSCDISGVSSFGFHSAGVATGMVDGTAGMVDGTYTESGTVAIGPQAKDPGHFGGAIPVGQVLDVKASFEIRSAADELLVRGTKQLIEPLPLASGAAGICLGPDDSVFGMDVDATITGNLCYDAVFADGSTERGTAALMLQSIGGNAVFQETFPGSPEAECPPLVPTSKAQCKKGGAFEDSDQFANQGDCVSFVATGGRNAPGRHRSK